MSARARQSTFDPGSPAIQELPPYEVPENPLNIHGQRALRNILRDNDHQSLEHHLRQAAQVLNDNANAINYRLSDRKTRHLKRAEKHPDALTEVDEQRGEHLEQFDVRVTAMTKRIEEAVRKAIDGQNFAGFLAEELGHVNDQAIANANASQQMTQQTQTQPRRGHGDDDDDDDDDEQTDYDPTLPGQTQHAPVQPIHPRRLFEERYQAQKDRYQARSLPNRYSSHADYVGFKRAVHDGSYPNGEGPALPHADSWFTPAGAPAAGATQTRQGGGGGDSDDDDDIAVAYERISTRCPLTLKELEDPVTSTKCPHTFERANIMQMLQASNLFTGGSGRRGARDGLRMTQCPQTGCDKMLTQNDLRPDPSLIRKIRRIQKSRQEMEDSDEENGDVSRVLIPSDNPDGFDDIDEPASQAVVPKLERVSGISQTGSISQDPGLGSSGSSGMGYDGAIESSNIVDLGSDSGDDDDE